MPAAVDLHEHAVAAHADRGPDSDHRIGAEHLAGHLQRYGQDVPVGEGVLPGPVESMKGAVRIGEERIAADSGEEPAWAGPHGARGGIEADGRGRDEDLTGWLRPPPPGGRGA